MPILAITNQKGGVGKTTTTHNLAFALTTQYAQKILLVDLDAQGSLTKGLGISLLPHQPTIYELLVSKGAPELGSPVTLNDALVQISPNLHAIPARSSMAVCDVAFSAFTRREYILKEVLEEADKYDIILLDCPPNLGLVTTNAFTAADYLIIPVQPEYYCLEGLALLQDTIVRSRQKLNPHLDILGILVTLYDKRLKLNRDVLDLLQDTWKNKMFQTIIRKTVRLSEAPSNGEDIFSYSPGSMGAEDYSAFANELMQKLSEV